MQSSTLINNRFFQKIVFGLILLVSINLGCKKETVEEVKKEVPLKAYVSANIGGKSFYSETMVSTFGADSIEGSNIVATDLTMGALGIYWNGGKAQIGDFNYKAGRTVPRVFMNYKPALPLGDPQYKMGNSDDVCKISITSIKDGRLTGTFSGKLNRIKDSKLENIEIKDGKLEYILVK